MSSFSLGSGIIDFLANTGPLQAGLRDFESTMAKLQYRMNEIGGMASRAFYQGREAIQGAFQSASMFETQMAKVQTVMQGNTQFAGLFAQGIQRLSMQFGIGTKDLAQSLYDILSSGVPAAEALNVLSQAAKLSVGGFADMATTTRGLTAVMNAYSIQASDVVTVSDQMYAAARQGKLEFEDFARVMGYIAPYAAQMGVAMDDLFVSLSVMTNTGSSAQQAATQMLNLIKGFNRPSKQSAAAAKEFGIELGHSQLQGANFYKTLLKLAEIQKKHGPEAIGHIFPDLRGTRGVTALLARLHEVPKFSDEIKKSSGEAEEAFRTMSQTSAFQIAQLKQTLEQLQVALGKALIPMIARWGKMLGDALPAIINWVYAHQGAIRQTVQWGAALLGVMIIAPRLVATLRLLSFTVQLVATGFSFVARAIAFAFVSPLMAAAIAAIVAFAAVMARSIYMNEKWETSAYKVARTLGLFRDATQNYQAALEEYAEASNEALKTQALANAAKKNNEPISEQIKLLSDAVDAQRNLVRAAQAAQTAAKAQGAETTFTAEQIAEQAQKIAEAKAKTAKDPWGGPRKEDIAEMEHQLAFMKKNAKDLGDAGFSDKQIEAQKKKLSELEAKLKELTEGKVQGPDFKQFMKQFLGLEDQQLNVKLKPPDYKGLAEVADSIQKIVFGTEFDPAVKATVDNTKVTKDNTAALKMLGEVFKQTGKLPIVLGR